MIVASVWSLTRDSLRLSLDGVPVGIRIEEVEKTMEAVPGVKAVHHIHVWAISTTENALTAHVVLAELPRMETVKRQLKAELESGRDPSCDARIRIFGRTLPRDVRLIARPAREGLCACLLRVPPVFPPCGGTYMLSEKTIRPGKVGLFLLSRAAFVPFGHVYLRVQGTGS